MAVEGGTFSSTSAVGNRQEIDDIVSRITPEDTPIYSMIDKDKTSTTSPEWETDTLRAPAANAQLEGDIYAFGSITPAVRLKNYTQILRQGWVVSNTQEAVDNVGNVEKFAEKKIKSGIEVRKDVELSIVSNTASVGGLTRVSGGLPTWLTTNVDRGRSGVQWRLCRRRHHGGRQCAVRSGRSPRPCSIRSWAWSTRPAAIFVRLSSHPYVKSVFVTFMSDTNVAPFRYAVTGKKEHHYRHCRCLRRALRRGECHSQPGHGDLHRCGQKRFPHRSGVVAWTWLRPIQEDPNLAKTHDAKKGMIIGEGTSKVKNEAGLACRRRHIWHDGST